ncbi:MAG: tetratricopeptide repeat protein [Desulfosalsimonadaceae bacterium]
MENYKLALKYDSDFAYARYNLGDALFRMGDFDNAILQLEWVVKRRYCPGKIFMKIGDAYLAAGHKEKAEIQYRTAAQLGIAEAESRLEKLFAHIYSSSP